jgi:acetyl esterase
MSNDPVPTPNPYVDPQMVAFEEQVAKLLPNGASLTSLSLSELRRTVREFQAPAPKDARVSTTSFDVKTSFGEVKTFILKPSGAEHALPVIFYVHGGGWILGNEFDWKSLLFDLVDRTGFAVVFAEYTFAPEAQFPVQQEQLLGVLQWVVKNGHSKGLKADKIAMVGDSAGGTLRPWNLRLCTQR